MGLSYILLYYRHNIKIVKTKQTKCQRDQDSPSPSTSAPSWLTSLEPRRERSCPGLRWSRDFGLTSRPRSSRTPRTSSTSSPTPRCSPSLDRRSSVPSGWPISSRPTCLPKPSQVKVSREEDHFDRNKDIIFEAKRLISHPFFLWTLFTTQYK